MTNQYETFSQSLRRVLSENELSITEVSNAVGFRSRNSMFRIVNGETSCKLNASFLADLRTALGTPLPKEAWNSLERALEIDRIGLQEYMNTQALSGLAIESNESPDPPRVVFLNEEGLEQDLPLTEALSAWTDGATQLDILMLSVCSRSICQTLADFLQDRAQTAQLSVMQVVYAGNDSVVQNLVGIQSLLDAPWYKAYLAKPDTMPTELLNIIRLGLILFKLVRPDGTHHAYTLLQTSPDCFTMGVISPQEALCYRYLLRYVRLTQLIKPEILVGDTPESFIGFTRHFAELERNVAIFSIKPDVPINYIPLHILEPVVYDSFSHLPFSDKDRDALIDGLRVIHRERIKNYETKRKVTHTVFSIDSMRHFVRTGRQSDHFFMLRPYTPAERREILMFLRRLAQENPFFSVYFIKEEHHLLPKEVTLYDGRVLTVMNSRTDYSVSHGHSESVIDHPYVLSQFKRFYMKEFLPKYACTQAQALRILDELIAEIPEKA